MLAQEQTRRRRVRPVEIRREEKQSQSRRQEETGKGKQGYEHDVSSDRFFLQDEQRKRRSAKRMEAGQTTAGEEEEGLTSGPMPDPSTAATTWFVTTTAIPY